MAVQQHVLNWLYSVLTSEYQDVNRTYNDVAQALAQYPSLSPRTDVHTFPNGASALLLHLSGTVPAVFRGATYRYPISLWVPHAYPREAPLVYVTPTENMMVRPGQHVDPQGLVYHPYLVGWTEFWDKSTIVDFLTILRDVFAKEPPVISRQAARPIQPPPQPATSATPTPPPPIPPLPQELASNSRASTVSPASVAASPIQQPPAPPPKGNSQQQQQYQQSVPVSPASGTPTPPPVPPHPHPTAAGSRQSTIYDPRAAQQQQGPTPPPPAPLHPSSSAGQPVEAAAGPSQARPGLPPIPGRPPYQQSPLSQPPMSPSQQQQQQVYPSYLQQQQSPPPQTPQAYGSPPTTQAPSYYPYQQQGPPQQQQQQPQTYQQGPPPPWQSQQQQQQQQFTQQPRPKQPPPPDLMDEPLTLSIPAPGAGIIQPPPVPPNPEKDMLLHQLAQTLAAMRQHSRQQNDSSLSGLQAQRTAMLAAAQRMQQDMSDVAQLSALLTSNTAILHETLQASDHLIEEVSSTPTKTVKPPAIDDLLVGPTAVANQLYELVAEERALADAIFMLGRAVERGRIPPAVFAKMTRSLAREWYLKKALVRKIGRGMGLAPA